MKRVLLFVLASLWLVCSAAGMRMLWNYALTPGESAHPANHWPVRSHLQRVPGRFTLVMTVHPQCPCTRASIGELSWILARTGSEQLSTYVLLLKPTAVPKGWEQTDLWKSLSAIPGVTIWPDEDGREALLFDAHTSGQTLLYDGQGLLLFRGGITAARGHAGANEGREGIVALLGGHQQVSETPVYGCPLREVEPRSDLNRR